MKILGYKGSCFGALLLATGCQLTGTEAPIPMVEKPTWMETQELKVSPQQGLSLSDRPMGPQRPWRDQGEFDILFARLSQNNLDFKIQQIELMQERQRLGIQNALSQPQLNLNASGSNSKTKHQKSVSSMGVSLLGSWEMDLWGELKAMREEAKSQLNISQLGAESLELSLKYECLEQCLRHGHLLEQKRVLEDQIMAQNSIVEHQVSLFKNGRSQHLRVLQQREVLASLGAELPNLEQQINTCESALSSLLNDDFNKIKTMLPRHIADQNPMLHEFEIPEDWLERRFDTRRAWMKVIQSHHSLKAASARRLPTLTLNAQLGLMGSHPKEMVENWIRQFSASLLGPIFDGRRLEWQEMIAELDIQKEMDRYKSVVLKAYLEIQNNMERCRTQHDTWMKRKQQWTWSKRVLQELEKRYRLGQDSFENVLMQKTKVLSIERQLVQLKSEYTLRLAQVDKSLAILL